MVTMVWGDGDEMVVFGGGERIGTVRVGGDVYSAVGLKGGVLYVGDLRGAVEALRGATKKSRAKRGVVKSRGRGPFYRFNEDWRDMSS